MSSEPETEGVRIESTIVMRMGDGSYVESTRDELRADIEDGARQAAKRAKAPSPTPAELDRLPEIFASEERMTRVPLGDEVVLTCDVSIGLHLSRLGGLTGAEPLGGGLCEQQQDASSHKALTTAVADERRRIQKARYRLTIPVRHGAQTDLDQIADIEMERDGEASPMEVKLNMVELPHPPINCVGRFRKRVHSLSARQAGRSS